MGHMKGSAERVLDALLSPFSCCAELTPHPSGQGPLRPEKMPSNRMGAEPSNAEGSCAFSLQDEAADTSHAVLRWADRLGGEDNSFLTTSIRR